MKTEVLERRLRDYYDSQTEYILPAEARGNERDAAAFRAKTRSAGTFGRRALAAAVIAVCIIGAYLVYAFAVPEKYKIKFVETLYSFDVNNYRQLAVYNSYIFVGRVECETGSSYRDGELYTEYEVTPLKNIKGSLKTGETLIWKKQGGMNALRTVYTLPENDIIPEPNGLYIICSRAEEDGSALYSSGANSAIALEEGIEETNIDLSQKVAEMTYSCENPQYFGTDGISVSTARSANDACANPVFALDELNSSADIAKLLNDALDGTDYPAPDKKTLRSLASDYNYFFMGEVISDSELVFTDDGMIGVKCEVRVISSIGAGEPNEDGEYAEGFGYPYMLEEGLVTSFTKYASLTRYDDGIELTRNDLFPEKGMTCLFICTAAADGNGLYSYTPYAVYDITGETPDGENGLIDDYAEARIDAPKQEIPVYRESGLIQTAHDAYYTVKRLDDGTYSIAFNSTIVIEDMILPSEYKGVKITAVEPGGFEENICLNKLTIPEGYTTIGENAFVRCTTLTEVSLPDTLTYIGDNAFAGCRELKKINLPASLEYIGEEAFRGCAVRAVVIPESVKFIGEKAFYNCASNSVVIKGGAEIGDFAFYGCSTKTVKINGGVEKIGERAFQNCGRLTSVTLPEGLAELGAGAFANCTKLKSAVIPKTVSSIGDSAFSYCTSLEYVNIPESVVSIGKNAFFACRKLKEIRYSGTGAQWDAISKAEGWDFDAAAYAVITAEEAAVSEISEEGFEETGDPGEESYEESDEPTSGPASPYRYSSDYNVPLQTPMPVRDVTSDDDTPWRKAQTYRYNDMKDLMIPSTNAEAAQKYVKTFLRWLNTAGKDGDAEIVAVNTKMFALTPASLPVIPQKDPDYETLRKANIPYLEKLIEYYKLDMSKLAVIKLKSGLLVTEKQSETSLELYNCVFIETEETENGLSVRRLLALGGNSYKNSFYDQIQRYVMTFKFVKYSNALEKLRNGDYQVMSVTQDREGVSTKSPLPLDVVYDEQIKDCTLVYCYTYNSRVEPFYEFTVADGDNEYKLYVCAVIK